MQSPPTAAKPLLVPSPTSSTAPAFIMINEEELAPYSSTVIPLPPTIPELIQCFERQHERCVQMTRFVEKVGVEAAKLSAAAAAPLCAIAAEALGTPPPKALTDTAATVPSSSTTNSPPPSSAAPVVARGVVASPDGKSSGPVTAAGSVSGSAAVVRGTVLTGRVVSATGAAAGGVAGGSGNTASGGGGGGASPMAPLRAVVASSASSSAPHTPSKPPQSTTAPSSAVAAAVSPDELQVLRAKALAMEATQLQLASTQDELRAAEHNWAREKERRAKVEDALAQLREELAATDMDNSATSQSDVPPPGSRFAQLQISFELSEQVLSDTKLKHQSVLYTLAQLNEKMAVMKREKAFLEEKNTHLEGQLQRLLMSSMVTGSPNAPSAPAQRGGTTGAGGNGGGAGSGQSTANTTTATAAAGPRLSASESYQKSALEKQIADLQSMTDKLTRDLRKQTARRAKAEEMVQGLQKEVTDLKASALQFRRQINESELELERAVSRKEEDERLRQLERDGNRLRTALRERTEHFLREKTEWESQRDVLEGRAKVQETATRQLLRRLLACQVREVTLRQCDYAASLRRGKNAASAAGAAHGGDAGRGRAAGGFAAASGSGAGALRHSAASPPSTVNTAAAQGAAHFGTAGTGASLAPSSANAGVSDTSFAASLSTGPVGAAADTATLVNRERQLEELKHTFDRRVALVDAQRKAEVQQLHALNKELRTALTTSQEELNQKTRMLEAVQQQQQQQRQQQQPLGLAKFNAGSSASLTPVALGRSSSSASERRDTAAAWVCRTDGVEGLNTSADDLSDGVGAVYSAAHTPLVASPRQVTDIERRYDPEHMSTWEAVQVENEALLDRLTTMQEEKWKLTSYVEDLQRQSNTLKEELKRNASTMNQLLAAGVLTPAAVSRGSAEGSLRALQCLLQETLQEKFALEEKLRSLGA